MDIMKLTIKEDFHRGKHYLSTFFLKRIGLFAKRYDIKFITLISMYHLNLLCACVGQLSMWLQIF